MKELGDHIGYTVMVRLRNIIGRNVDDNISPELNNMITTNVYILCKDITNHEDFHVFIRDTIRQNITR